MIMFSLEDKLHAGLRIGPKKTISENNICIRSDVNDISFENNETQRPQERERETDSQKKSNTSLARCSLLIFTN